MNVIERLYRGLAERDGEAMASCYTGDARFEDPVFGVLTGDRVGEMWRMLTEASTDLEVETRDVAVDGEIGEAVWVARYIFAPTARRVVNRGHAEFRFRSGLIAGHIDRFSFHRWARQALGLPGLLMGWAPAAQRSVRRRAVAALDRYTAARG